MKANKLCWLFCLMLTLALVPLPLKAQLVMVVNSLADDEDAYPYDDPETETDESEDGICGDGLGRCTIRAAIEESINMEQRISLTFSVEGTINLIDVLYPVDLSILNGEGKIVLSGISCIEVYENVTIAGFKFNNCFEAVRVSGNRNGIGSILGGNVFTNCYIGLYIEGDENLVISNYFGLDSEKNLGPNQFGILISGSRNYIGLNSAAFSNTICASAIAGITITEGEHNVVNNNFIGTTDLGELGYGNLQGVVIAGSDRNTIGGNDLSYKNIISGNTTVGISISGVPPDSRSYATEVFYNIIGLDSSQTFSIPNGIGISVTNGAQLSHIERNVICANLIDGIEVFGYDEESRTFNHIIQNNYIGRNLNGVIIPNGRNGIFISGRVEDVTIGGTTNSNKINYITGNTGTGISITSQFGFSPSLISIRKNLVYQNGISNLYVSPTSNNGIQPPYSLSFSNDVVAGIHELSNAIIDVYKADFHEASASAYQWLGSTNTDANGIFSFGIADQSIEALSFTATSNTGNTSGFSFIELITAIDEEDDKISTEFSLEQNFPNPFNPGTLISFSIPSAQFVSLKIFNSLGAEVAELLNEYKPTGKYRVDFNASGLSSGIYFYTLQTGDFIETKKMIIVK